MILTDEEYAALPATAREARERGLSHFSGVPCESHPNAPRSRHNQMCTECFKLLERRRRQAVREQKMQDGTYCAPGQSLAREQAKATGSTTYHGRKCKHHPELNGLRYTDSTVCPSCSYRAAKAAKKEKQRRAREALIASSGHIRVEFRTLAGIDPYAELASLWWITDQGRLTDERAAIMNNASELATEIRNAPDLFEPQTILLTKKEAGELLSRWGVTGADMLGASLALASMVAGQARKAAPIEDDDDAPLEEWEYFSDDDSEGRYKKRTEACSDQRPLTARPMMTEAIPPDQ